MAGITESREIDNSEKTVLRNWCIVPGENPNMGLFLSQTPYAIHQIPFFYSLSYF
jgi:hypothetical protein